MSGNVWVETFSLGGLPSLGRVPAVEFNIRCGTMECCRKILMCWAIRFGVRALNECRTGMEREGACVMLLVGCRGDVPPVLGGNTDQWDRS